MEVQAEVQTLFADEHWLLWVIDASFALAMFA
jgi:hypothetical protein